MEQQVSLIAIGGSWGGLQASLSFLSALPADFSKPVILVLHRLRNFNSDLASVFRNKIALEVKEIEEKEKIKAGTVYIAPSNYHVLIERDQTFSLDASEYENFSRPSIDVTFSSIADVFGSGTAGILLSGASKDGSGGLKRIREKGGIPIVQDPSEAEVGTMPASALQLVPDSKILTLKEIQEYLCFLK